MLLRHYKLRNHGGAPVMFAVLVRAVGKGFVGFQLQLPLQRNHLCPEGFGIII